MSTGHHLGAIAARGLRHTGDLGDLHAPPRTAPALNLASPSAKAVLRARISSPTSCPYPMARVHSEISAGIFHRAFLDHSKAVASKEATRSARTVTSVSRVVDYPADPLDELLGGPVRRDRSCGCAPSFAIDPDL